MLSDPGHAIRPPIHVAEMETGLTGTDWWVFIRGQSGLNFLMPGSVNRRFTMNKRTLYRFYKVVIDLAKSKPDSQT